MYVPTVRRSTSLLIATRSHVYGTRVPRSRVCAFKKFQSFFIARKRINAPRAPRALRTQSLIISRERCGRESCINVTFKSRIVWLVGVVRNGYLFRLCNSIGVLQSHDGCNFVILCASNEDESRRFIRAYPSLNFEGVRAPAANTYAFVHVFPRHQLSKECAQKTGN